MHAHRAYPACAARPCSAHQCSRVAVALCPDSTRWCSRSTSAAGAMRCWPGGACGGALAAASVADRLASQPQAVTRPASGGRRSWRSDGPMRHRSGNRRLCYPFRRLYGVARARRRHRVHRIGEYVASRYFVGRWRSLRAGWRPDLAFREFPMTLQFVHGGVDRDGAPLQFHIRTGASAASAAMQCRPKGPNTSTCTVLRCCPGWSTATSIWTELRRGPLASAPAGEQPA